MTVQSTHRWRGIVAVALLAGAVGLVTTTPSLLLMAVVGIVYAAYPQFTTPPSADLAVTRTLSDPRPSHETPVEVTVTVSNTGKRTLPDVRLVDGVPPMLSVTDGTPRHAAAIRPGGTTSFTYTVNAVYGVHRFEPATAIVRDLSGAYEVQAELPAEDAIECQRPVSTMPVQPETQRHTVGPIVANDGGSGTEFHQTREYHYGDAMNRIDWKRFARTGTLTTVEFEEERAASVVLVLDGRAPAYRAASEGVPHAVAYEVAAAEQLLSVLLEAQHAVGVATIGREPGWLAPNVGTAHFHEALRLLSTHPSLAAIPPNGDGLHEDQATLQARELRRRLGRDDQLVLLSPLADKFIVATAARLAAAGHAVTVISPDVTTDDTLGGRLARFERRQRIHSLRASDVFVVDWNPDRALGTTLLAVEERWIR